MVAAKETLLRYVCPSLGTIMASAMFSAPIKSLREALSRGSLKDLNPTPWAFMTGNCLGWVAYSFATQDMFVLASNLPGLILSVWLNVGAAKLQYLERYETLKTITQNDFDSSYSLRLEHDIDTDDCDDGNHDEGSGTNAAANTDVNNNISPNNRSREADGISVTATSNDLMKLPSSTRHEHWLLLILILWGITLSIVIFVPMSNDHGAYVIGIVVNLNLIVFYGAPLSTILNVLKTRSSNSIHRRTLAMAFLNSFFWSVYGLELLDMVIFIPNLCGFLLSIVQLILCIIFSDKISEDEGMTEQLVDHDSASFDDELEDRNNGEKSSENFGINIQG